MSLKTTKASREGKGLGTEKGGRKGKGKKSEKLSKKKRLKPQHPETGKLQLELGAGTGNVQGGRGGTCTCQAWGCRVTPATVKTPTIRENAIQFKGLA